MRSHVLYQAAQACQEYMHSWTRFQLVYIPLVLVLLVNKKLNRSTKEEKTEN